MEQEIYYVNSVEGDFGTDWPRTLKAAEAYRDSLNRLAGYPRFQVETGKIAVLRKDPPAAADPKAQKPGEKHYDFSKRVIGLTQSGHSKCWADHITFGGRCYNCGYDPANSGLGILEG